MNGLQGIGLASMIAGVCLVLYSGRALVRRRALLSNAVRTKGKVIRLRQLHGSDDTSSTTIIPVVRYKANDGLTYERGLPATHDEDQFKVGATVALLYEEGNPTNVTDTNCRWQDLSCMTVMSLLILAFGAALYFCTVDARD
jgi:hypothetical protein